MNHFVLFVIMITLTDTRRISPRYNYSPRRNQDISNFGNHGRNDNGLNENSGYSLSSNGGVFNDGSKSNDEYTNGYNGQSNGNIIHKHIYVHVPPAEENEGLPQRPVILPPREKHYKIIFIKVPTQAALAPPVLTLPNKEEKTLVYVLVKKPEEAPLPPIPTATPTLPSKPEVFFIRYQTQTANGNGNNGGTENGNGVNGGFIGESQGVASDVFDNETNNGESIDRSYKNGPQNSGVNSDSYEDENDDIPNAFSVESRNGGSNNGGSSDRGSYNGGSIGGFNGGAYSGTRKAGNNGSLYEGGKNYGSPIQYGPY